MEKWTERVIDTLETDETQILCIADFVDTIEEKEVDGAEEHTHEHDESDEHEESGEHEEHDEHEESGEYDEHDDHVEGSFDEHIWTSPENAIKMLNALEKVLEKLDNSNSKKYVQNANDYANKMKLVDNKIREIVENRKRDRLVFADKMPMQYFIDYYGLKVTAAFDGCSTETEPSAKTIAYIEDKVKEEKIPVLLYIELNTGNVAKTIASETGVTAMQIQTLHNVSKDDFEAGETWVSLMERNIPVLKAALQ